MLGPQLTGRLQRRRKKSSLTKVGAKSRGKTSGRKSLQQSVARSGAAIVAVNLLNSVVAVLPPAEILFQESKAVPMQEDRGTPAHTPQLAVEAEDETEEALGVEVADLREVPLPPLQCHTRNPIQVVPIELLPIIHLAS